jgi:hypothetical protein
MASISSIITALVALLGEESSLGTIYSRHNVADLVVSATTVGILRVEPRHESEMVADSETIIPWDVTITIRIHTAYVGGIEDSATATTLADVVIEKLRTNLTAITDCHIDDVEVDYWRSFSESATLGAEITVKILNHEHYIQET